MKVGSKNGFKWKQREDLIEGRIVSLGIWDEHGCRVSCKGLDIIEKTLHVVERRNCVIW